VRVDPIVFLLLSKQSKHQQQTSGQIESFVVGQSSTMIALLCMFALLFICGCLAGDVLPMTFCRSANLTCA
jgi:hypothetical protein